MTIMYESLSKVFYKDTKNYNNKYIERFATELSIKLPIYIHNNQVFFTTPIEMINKIERIFKMNNNISID